MKKIKKDDLNSINEIDKAGKLPVYIKNPFSDTKQTISIKNGIHLTKNVAAADIRKEYLKHLKDALNMLPSAQVLYNYCCDILLNQSNKDTIYLDWHSLQKYIAANGYKLSQKSFYTAKEWLISNEFICPFELKNMYWVNHNMFINDDRVFVLYEYVL